MIASKAESPVRAKFLRTRHCPNCGTSAHIPEVSSIPRGEDETWDQLSAAWRGFFKKKTFLTFARCSACGLLYAPNYFTDSALGALYGNMPDNTAGLSESYLEKTQRGYFRLLDRHSDWRGDYFELGPDTGLFTQFVAAKKKHGRLWLFEPNQAVHAELAKRGGGLEVSIRPEMKDFSAVPDGSIETCVMIHVLDHLPDAQIVLKSLRQKMAPGGKLLVVTHDERSLLAQDFKSALARLLFAALAVVQSTINSELSLHLRI